MRLLLGTHVLLWAALGHPRLTAGAAAWLRDPDNEVFASVVSLWEIAIKVRTGKLARAALDEAEASIARGSSPLGLERPHIEAVLTLPHIAGHRGPFDHMLVGQAVAERLVFLSDDRWVERHPVSVLRAGA